MIFRTLVFFALVNAVSAMEAYTAMIMPLSSNYTAEGTMVVMVEEGSTNIFYGAHVTGLESSLDAMMCTAMNGCGLHIHVGMSCDDVTSQGGHLYETTEDPWLEARHSTTEDGVLIEGTWLEIGTNDVNGRVVIVHNEAGERAGCGILEPAGDSFTQLSTMATPLGDDSMTEAEAFVVGDDMFMCYAGMARGLEANVMSFMSDGMDCNVTNGCGTHVHMGDSCESIDTQGGHLYETDEDPWAMESYLSTTSDGMAYFGNCLMVGAATLMVESRPFIVHDSMGNRVSCGILESMEAVGEAPSPSMGMMEPTAEMAPSMMGSSSSTRLSSVLQTLALLFIAVVNI